MADYSTVSYKIPPAALVYLEECEAIPKGAHPFPGWIVVENAEWGRSSETELLLLTHRIPYDGVTDSSIGVDEMRFRVRYMKDGQEAVFAELDNDHLTDAEDILQALADSEDILRKVSDTAGRNFRMFGPEWDLGEWSPGLRVSDEQAASELARFDGVSDQCGVLPDRVSVFFPLAGENTCQLLKSDALRVDITSELLDRWSLLAGMIERAQIAHTALPCPCSLVEVQKSGVANTDEGARREARARQLLDNLHGHAIASCIAEADRVPLVERTGLKDPVIRLVPDHDGGPGVFIHADEMCETMGQASEIVPLDALIRQCRQTIQRSAISQRDAVYGVQPDKKAPVAGAAEPTI